MSSAARIFAHAARRPDATTTTIGFGDRTTVLVAPRTYPKQVLHMRTDLTLAFMGDTTAQAERPQTRGTVALGMPTTGP
ncbi:hypothetical protein OHB44_09945 [Micromonospora sp. NBC_00821]|uniref:hypothetical protein n=1 Tax=Micromonospora sp. NBC_00821 TaxID=2975977 RepID=UPI002ED43626|nr:hypothetical protein OHB44_09945 [Micromonospora sp. NBC_00821]